MGEVEIKAFITKSNLRTLSNGTIFDLFGNGMLPIFDSNDNDNAKKELKEIKIIITV